MNKNTFMTKLKRNLVQLKQSTRQEILADFEEHFADGAISGKTEAQVAEELGNPKQLAEHYITTAENDDKASIPEAVGRGIFAGLGLLLLNAMIIIPIVAGLFAAVVSLWTVPISTFASAIALIVYPIFGTLPVSIPYFFTLLASIALLGFSVASAIGMYYLSKYFVKGVVAFAKMQYRVIAGGAKG